MITNFYHFLLVDFRLIGDGSWGVWSYLPSHLSLYHIIYHIICCLIECRLRLLGIQKWWLISPNMSRLVFDKLIMTSVIMKDDKLWWWFGWFLFKVPRHEVLSDDEKADLLDKYKVYWSHNLPCHLISQLTILFVSQSTISHLILAPTPQPPKDKCERPCC